jgi:hypothetical protein
MRELDAIAPIEVSLIVEDVQDADSVRSILEISDKVREEYGLAVRVDTVSSVAMEPLTGWVHTLSRLLDFSSVGDVRGEGGYVILRDGSHVRVIVTGACTEESLEKALVEAALQALAHSNTSEMEPLDDNSDRLRGDPGSFASGEYVIPSAA